MILCATDAWFILCTNKIYTYVLKKSYFIFPIIEGFGECTDEGSLQGSVPPIRSRTTVFVGPCSWWAPALGGPLDFSLVRHMGNAALDVN